MEVKIGQIVWFPSGGSRRYLKGRIIEVHELQSNLPTGQAITGTYVRVKFLGTSWLSCWEKVSDLLPWEKTA